MYTLTPEEKTVLIMFYTPTCLLRAETVIRSGIARVSTWLRNQGAPEYIHMLRTEVLDFSNNPVSPVHYNEFYLATSQVMAYHLAPPAADPVDYDLHETNRVKQMVTLHIGTFLFKGVVRIPPATTVAGQLEAAHSPWASLYEVSVSNPLMPSIQYKFPMALFNPTKVLIGLH